LECAVFHYRGTKDFQNRGVKSRMFKLFVNVKKEEIIPYLDSTRKLSYDVGDVWVDIDRKALIYDTVNGADVIDFAEYDKLLNVIIGIGRELYIRDMMTSLDHAKVYLTSYRRYPYLLMDEKEIDNLVNAIDRAKEHIFNENFTLKIWVGDIEIKDVDNFIKEHPETERAIRDGIERYRELCWESEEDDGIDNCNHVTPSIYESIYAVLEEKRIISILNVDQVGEIYRTVKGYEDAYSFLKALDEYEAIAVARY